MRNFSEILSLLRQRTGLKQKEIAFIFGVSEGTFSGWKKSEGSPWLTPVVLFCEEKGFDLNEILLGQNPQSINPASLDPLSADERKAFIDLAKTAIEILSRDIPKEEKL